MVPTTKTDEKTIPVISNLLNLPGKNSSPYLAIAIYSLALSKS